jgi:hypothetical protein
MQLLARGERRLILDLDHLRGISREYWHQYVHCDVKMMMNDMLVSSMNPWNTCLLWKRP